MSEEYVKWDVHATTDAFTPRMEYDDPLQQFSESEVSFFFWWKVNLAANKLL